MTVGDFLDKHFIALYSLAIAYIAFKFIGLGIIAWIKKSLDD